MAPAGAGHGTTRGRVAQQSIILCRHSAKIELLDNVKGLGGGIVRLVGMGKKTQS